MTKPRVLYWDVETTHSIVATFPLFKANIAHQTVLQDWYIICAAWRWKGQKRIHSVSLLDDPVRFDVDYTNDYHVIETLHGVLSQADAIVAHNGDAFDIKKFNARAIYHGFDPIPPIVQEDTLKMARSRFKFSYNRLDYIAKFLGVGGKIKTDVELWLDCLRGDKRAVRKMVMYNKGDIVILEAVHNKLLPFCPSKLNLNHFTKERVCDKCGSDNIIKEGFKYTRVGKQQQIKCNDCGGWASYPVSKTGKEGFIR